MVLKITAKEMAGEDVVDLDRLIEVINKGYEDVQIAVNTTKTDHRFPQGMLVILGNLKTILGKTPRKA